MSKAGTQTVTVSYKGLQASYDIKVVSITGLKVVPKVTEYKYGKALDKSGNAVYYVLSDGTEVALPIKDLASVKYSGYSRYKTGTQTVTVTYKGYKTTYTVTVTNRAPVQQEQVGPHQAEPQQENRMIQRSQAAELPREIRQKIR